MSVEPEVGNKYRVSHSRKGKFIIDVTEMTDTWLTGIMIQGETETLLEENSKSKGEEVTIRISLCEFTKYSPVRNPEGIS